MTIEELIEKMKTTKNVIGPGYFHAFPEGRYNAIFSEPVPTIREREIQSAFNGGLYSMSFILMDLIDQNGQSFKNIEVYFENGIPQELQKRIGIKYSGQLQKNEKVVLRILNMYFRILILNLNYNALISIII